MADTPEIKWIELRQSVVQLSLTLAVGLIAAGVVFLIDVSDDVRAILLLLLLVAVVADVVIARRLTPKAVAAFAFIEASVDDAATSEKPPLRVRFRYVQRGTGSDVPEAEGVVLPKAYVSAYFTTFTYLLDGDAAWRRFFPRIVVIWADAINAEQFRAVRVRLKWR
jgi:hypothetical protein